MSNFFRNRNTLGKVPTLIPVVSGGGSLVFDNTIKSVAGIKGYFFYRESTDGKWIIPICTSDNSIITNPSNRYSISCSGEISSNDMNGDGKTGTAICDLIGKTFVREYKAYGNINYTLNGNSYYYNGTSWVFGSPTADSGRYVLGLIECA